VCVCVCVCVTSPLHHHPFFLCNAVKCVSLPREQSCKLRYCCFVSTICSLFSSPVPYNCAIYIHNSSKSPSSFTVTSLTALFPLTAASKLQAVKLSFVVRITAFVFDCPSVQTVTHRFTFLKSCTLKWMACPDCT